MFLYIWSILQHKWFVFLAGLRVGGIPLWRLLIHDLSKFSLAEMPAYKRRIVNYGRILDRKEWGYAWHHHYMKSPHHWEHWVFHWQPIQNGPDFYDGIVINGCLEMPEAYVREMVADWMGASRLYTGSWDMAEWLDKNLLKMKMHPKSLDKVLWVLGEQCYLAGLPVDTRRELERRARGKGVVNRV